MCCACDVFDRIRETVYPSTHDVYIHCDMASPSLLYIRVTIVDQACHGHIHYAINTQ